MNGAFTPTFPSTLVESTSTPIPAAKVFGNDKAEVEVQFTMEDAQDATKRASARYAQSLDYFDDESPSSTPIAGSPLTPTPASPGIPWITTPGREVSLY